MLEDNSIGGPRRITCGMDGAGEPFAGAATIATFRLLERSHQDQRTTRRPGGEDRRQNLADAAEFARVDCRTGDGETPFVLARSELQQRLGPLQAIDRRIARTNGDVGLGDFRMGTLLPGRFENACRTPDIAEAGEEPSGDDGGRHEIGRKIVRLDGRDPGALGLPILGGERGRREDDGPLAPHRALVGKAVVGHGADRAQSALPVARDCLVTEERAGGPRRSGRGFAGGLGDAAGGVVIALALRLDIKTAEAGNTGRPFLQHGGKGVTRGGPVPFQLRRLGAEEKRQRCARQAPCGFHRPRAPRCADRRTPRR